LGNYINWRLTERIEKDPLPTSSSSNCRQFHQHLCGIFRTKFWRQSQNVTIKNCQKGCWYEKSSRKMLMKLRPKVLPHFSSLTVPQLSQKFASLKNDEN